VRPKTDADFILEDDLDIIRTDVSLEARRWVRRMKAQRIEQHMAERRKELQTTGPQPLMLPKAKRANA
jgi:hypothetical protein